MSDTIVVVGGVAEENVKIECWTVSQSNEVGLLCDIPDSDIRIHFSVCKTPPFSLLEV